MELLGVRLVGLTGENLHKLLLSAGFVAAIFLVRAAILATLGAVPGGSHSHRRIVFWVRQAASIVTAILITLSLVSIWFDNPVWFATALGLVSAGSPSRCSAW